MDRKLRISWLVFQILLAESLIIYAPLVLYQQLSSILYSVLLGMGLVVAIGLGVVWGLARGRY